MPVRETVFMFSGQGSQFFHMGKALFDTDDTFRSSMLRLDAIAQRVIGESVVESLYSAERTRGDTFDRTLLTHPAIFMVEYSLAQTLIHAGLRPDSVLGVSLGSFAAAAVAGCVDVVDALNAVVQQALALEAHCAPGGMIAIMADPALFEEDFIRSRSELAAVNFSSHFTVSAKSSDLAIIETELKRRELTHLRLPVSFAFHSRWVDEAEASFSAFALNIAHRPGQLPLVCCERAAILSETPERFFWDVVRRPILFRESIALLERQGPRRYIDVGPAGTLATFLKYIQPASSASTMHAVLTPYGHDQRNLATLLAAAAH